MSEEFMLLPASMLHQQSLIEIRKCNDYTSVYGLRLSEPDIKLLVENRKESLTSNGRIEFGGGVIDKLIMEFANSPYIQQDNYVSKIQELQETFYYFKNETLDELGDDEIIRLMKQYFDTECQGSTEYLQSTVVEKISRKIRFGNIAYGEPDVNEDVNDDLNEDEML